ncbi:Regulatory protein BlaR1 [Posidoniimonas corsicana]|uniref:Regulatory protein BlaR1 n=1 Tax=Posidoniimonas corsicana TaxID=1938618 RepID=A0A5C5V7C4_9BACT|nr:M56 family metallopeptidase [Posidoniimonas corsicana]TWT33980.1 Regulatory protein BlaR1 [Posidoniimonas corsicana]
MIYDPLWRLAGWTMIHFLWIGGGVALATLLARAVLRSASPQARYGVSLLAFTLLAAAPAAIAAYLWQHQPAPAMPVMSAAAPPIASPLSGAPAAEPTATIDLAVTPLQVESPPPLENSSVDWAPPTANEVTLILPAPTASEQLTVWLDLAAEWLPWLWLAGAPLTFLLLATGLIGVERLRRGAQPVTTGPLHEALLSAANKLRLGGRVALALSDRVAQPVLIGVLRPLVLLPASAATGWTSDQLEMVLLHELAHARRWDNLVNLLQRLVESLLFFHPAVWLVSRWLRADREQCCDALVVRLTEDPRSYAELLVTVAEQSSAGRPALAAPGLVATGMASHPLTRRVRRILQLEEEPMLVSKRLLLALLVVGLGLTGACGYTFSQGPEAAEPLQEAEPPKKRDERSSGATEVIEHTGTNGRPGVGFEIGTSKPVKAENQPPRNPHFLSLEDQRVADLAYKMLDIEVTPLSDEQVAAIKERGFDGGVFVSKGTYAGPGALPEDRSRLLIHHGDILVGLHAWPTVGFDGLAEILRRDDLAEFNPLKFYVLRPSLEEPEEPFAGRGGRGEFGGGRGGRGGFGGEMGGRGFGGGEMGGRGFGEGGFGGGYGGEFGGSAESAAPKVTLKLVTGRIAFANDAWQAEQDRLKKLKPATSGARDQPYVDPFEPMPTTRPQPTSNPTGNYQPYALPEPGATQRRPPVPSSSPPAGGLYQAPRSGPSDQPTYGIDPGPSPSPQPRSAPKLLDTPAPSPGLPMGEEILDSPIPAAAEAPVTGRPPLGKLTYNGRSFEDWNTQWRTELSEEKRIEAIEAFAAFGNAGHGEEATLAILDTVPVTPLTSEMRKAYESAFSGVRGIPYETWFPLVAKQCVNAPNDYGVFAGHLLRNVYPSSPDKLGDLHKLFAVPNPDLRNGILQAIFHADPTLAEPNIAVTFSQALQSDDASVVTSALATIRESAQHDALAVSSYAAPVYELLLHESSYVRRLARLIVAEFPKQKATDDLAGRIVKVLPRPEQGGFFGGPNSLKADESPEAARQVQLALVRTLACLSPSVLGVAEAQLLELLDSDDEQLSWAAAVAFDKLDNERIDGSSRGAYARILDRQVETLFPGIGDVDTKVLSANQNRIENRLGELVRTEMQTYGVGGGGFQNALWIDWYNRAPEPESE